MAPTVHERLILDDDKKFALMKFRRSVHDILEPKHDDQFLLRWLRARNWDTIAAEKMLRNSMEWRKKWDVDNLDKWPGPEVVTKHYPSGVSGFTEEGIPIYIVPIGALDVVGLINSAARMDLMRFTIKVLEHTLNSNKKGKYEVIAIFDLEGFKLKDYAWKPAAELIISLLQIYEQNYPETLRMCYIINAPRVFALAFNVIKKFMNDYTISKIQVYKSEPHKWKKAIVQLVPPDMLPEWYGGTLVDPDGDPKCPSKVKPGAKVPKSYYDKRFLDQKDLAGEEYTSVVVKKGGKFTLDFIVAEPGCFIKWTFRTDGHDIKFGITYRDADDNVLSAIERRRVNSHQIEETGVVECVAPATYTVIFDNTYSMMRSKKLQYIVELTDPIDNLKLPLSDDVVGLENSQL